MDVLTCRLRAALPYWEKGAAIALVVSLLVFLYELAFAPGHHLHGILKMLEGVIVSVFLIEVIMHLITTDNRKLYLKKNWLYIISILPLTAMFRMLRLGRTAQLARFAKLIDVSKLIRTENSLIQSMAILSSAPLIKARRAFLMGYHFHHADMGKISPMKKCPFYFDPSLDPTIAEGFFHGYVQKKSAGSVPRTLAREAFGPLSMLERTLVRGNHACAAEYLKKIDSFLPKGGVIITSTRLDSPVRTSAFVSEKGSIVVSINPQIVAQEDDPHIRYLLGSLLAYHALGRAHEPCFERNCVCSNHDTESLLHLCRRAYGGYIPLCNRHSSNGIQGDLYIPRT